MAALVWLIVSVFFLILSALFAPVLSHHDLMVSIFSGFQATALMALFYHCWVHFFPDFARRHLAKQIRQLESRLAARKPQ